MRQKQLLRSLLILSLIVQNFIGLGQAVSCIPHLIDSAKTGELVAVDHSQRHWCDANGGKVGLKQSEVYDLEETDSEQEDDRDGDENLAKHLIGGNQALEFDHDCFVRLHMLKEISLVYKTPVANHVVVRC